MQGAVVSIMERGYHQRHPGRNTPMEVDGQRLDHGSVPGTGKEGSGEECRSRTVRGISTAGRDEPAGGPSETSTAIIVWKGNSAW